MNWIKTNLKKYYLFQVEENLKKKPKGGQQVIIDKYYVNAI